jgi:SAM-dependent MidA family methyltransferase
MQHDALASQHSSVSSGHSAPLNGLIQTRIASAGGWLPFDQFMALALYAPGLGYYAAGHEVVGQDFTTAPELSPLFGRTLAVNVAQALRATGTREVFEFGAGTGALAQQLIETLASGIERYTIVDVSSALRARQQERLAPFGERVRWIDAWPETMHGVVVGNEVLDAMPVKLLQFNGAQWFERGVVQNGAGLAWQERPTDLRPPLDTPFVPGTVTEIHPQAEAFIASLSERLQRGAAIFIDYGFPDSEYYLPERHGGTLMCHRAHRADPDPLADVGRKDITAHINFSSIALAAQDAGFDVLGYTSQARFLVNSGLVQRMDAAREQGDWAQVAASQKLVAEHEMGELFKVMALGKGVAPFELAGFASGDRTHRL